MIAKNLLIGTAIGDAFGAGVEFQDRAWIQENVDFTEFVNARDKIRVPENQIGKFTQNYRPWDYTDDTEMTIGTMKAILSGKEFTEEVLVEAWMEEYDRGKQIKGYGRNGHGSMAWFYEGEKTLEEIRDFQRNRVNPGNAPAMRAVPIGLLADDNINIYAAVNANATHPNINAVLSSQCIARAAEYMLVKRGEPHYIIDYCFEKIAFHSEYTEYLKNVNKINGQRELGKAEHAILCGPQPIVEPYFLSGIHGLPSDSKYTAGCVLFILKYSKDAMDALRKSIYMGGDVDSVASIATGIMAGKTGLGSLPPFMLENIEDKAYLEQIAGEFDQKITALGRLKN